MAQENKSKVSILTNGIIKENPVLRLVLGTCSCLAVTTAVSSALGMGAAFTFVLVCSNILISLLRNVIPAKVHLPCYIVIIAGFVTIVQMVMHAYMDSLYTALGVFLPLIVVNCIILGRAEMFACKNNVVDSALDGVGMGIGYTLTVVLMATIREVLGSGNDARFAALLTAADKLGIQYIATGHHARVELGSDGVHTVCPAVDAVLDESAALAALPQDTLARLLLPLGEFTAADVQEMAQDFKVNGTV